MAINERIYLIDQLLSERRFVTIPQLLSRLEVSKATLKRDLTVLRDRFHAPIVFDKELGGYRFESGNEHHDLPYELPGLWFSSEEIHALLTMHYLLSNLDAGGLLSGHVQPLLSRLTALLGAADDSADEVRKRIRIEMVGTRHIHLPHFEKVGSSLLKRKRIRIEHYSRSKDEITQREVSPQRMVYYQGNWYLAAWCHTKNELRSFSVDSIRRVEILAKKAKDVPAKTLDEVLRAGYGIFAGKNVQWATLKFSPEAARWVANERWHQQQEGKLNDDGSYELTVPYSKDTELLMDILKYGARVKVLKPLALANRIVKEIEAMKFVYS